VAFAPEGFDAQIHAKVVVPETKWVIGRPIPGFPDFKNKMIALGIDRFDAAPPCASLTRSSERTFVAHKERMSFPFEL
jgi:hypothetical protein